MNLKDLYQVAPPVRQPVIRLMNPTAKSTWVTQVRSGVRLPCVEVSLEGLGLESQEIDQQNIQEALKNLYVLSPTQVGFDAVAQVAVAAATQPDKTIVAMLNRGDEGEEYTDEQRAEIAKLKDTIANHTDATVVESIADAVKSINEATLNRQGADLTADGSGVIAP